MCKVPDSYDFTCEIPPWLNMPRLSARPTDVSKPVLKTIAAMDLDKINMDLVESLLEWIVDGPHDYPPGRTGPHHPRVLHTQ